MFDTHSNFGYGTVATAPSPGTSGTAIVLGTATFDQFPDPGTSTAYNCTVWPYGTLPLNSNAEILTVASKGTNGTIGVTRAQESSTAINIQTGYQFAITWTKKKITDIEDPLTTGWMTAGETWTYASADDPTFTFTITGDKTSKYSVGMRLRVSQSTGGTKYFIVTKVAYVDPSTTVTVYGGTDHNLENEAISSPCFSLFKAPYGFPLDPLKWTVETKSVSDVSQSAPTSTTWYNLGTITISIPIGCWKVLYMATTQSFDTTVVTIDQYVTLSTANNSESDVDFTTFVSVGGASGTVAAYQTVFREKFLALTSKTAYYLNSKVVAASDEIHFKGNIAPTIIRAVCAYL